MSRIDNASPLSPIPTKVEPAKTQAEPATGRMQGDSYRTRKPKDASFLDKLKSAIPFAGPVLGIAGGGLLGLALGPIAGVAGALVGGLALGNLGIFAFHKLMRSAHPQPAIAGVDSVNNPHVVDDKVLRGGKPRPPESYRDLARAGVTTIVDLRAETNLKVDEDELERLGIERIHLPTRDGQPPSEADVRKFLEAVRGSRGKVYVHCGAGVGRTGSMCSAYLVASGQATPAEALKRSLAVGPPSLEQIGYIRGLGADDFSKPNPLLTGLSRALDAPRRLWSRLKHVNV